MSCTYLQNVRTKHSDAKAKFGDIDLLGTKIQDKHKILFAKERKERFEKLSAWKVSLNLSVCLLDDR